MHEEHIALATVGLELDLQAVVGEPADPGRAEGTPRWAQTSAASSGWALPLNTAMSRTTAPRKIDPGAPPVGMIDPGCVPHATGLRPSTPTGEIRSRTVTGHTPGW